MTHTNGEEQVRGLARVVSLALRFRAVVLILFLVMTGFLCLQLAHIEMAEDPTEGMVPPGHRFVPALRAIDEMGKTSENLIGIVQVKKGDVYNTETVTKIERMTRELMGVEEFIPKKIISLYTGMNHYDNTAEGLLGEPILGRITPETKEDFQAVKRRVAVNPFGVGHVVSYDGTATMIMAGIADLNLKAETLYKQGVDKESATLSLDQYKKWRIDKFHKELLRLVDTLKAKEEDENHVLYFTGDRLLAAELTSMAREQVPIAAGAMMLVMLGLLAGYFKSFRGALVPIFAFALSVLWGLGFLGATKIALNPMAFLFPLLLGVLSLVCSAMAMKAYDGKNAEAESKLQAIVATYRSAPVAASVVIAGLVCLAMLAAGVPMVRELGWFGLFWAVGTFVVVVLVCPVLMSLLPRPARAKGERAGGMFESLAKGLTGIARGSGRVGISLLLALTLVAGLVCVWKLKVGDNVPGPAYVRSSDPWTQGFDLMAERFNGPYSFLTYVKAKEKGGLLNPEAINQMGDFSTYLNAKGLVRLSLAFDWVVKLARMALMDGNPKWWTVPASQKDMEGLSRLVTFSGALDVLVDESFSEATVASFFPERETDRIDEYASAMQAYFDNHPSEYIDFSLGGGLLAKAKAINDGTRDAYRKTMFLALVTVFLVGLVVTRSAHLGLIVTLSVAAGQALALLLMTVIGWPVSLAAVPAAVAGVGFGAVFGTYLVRQNGGAGSGLIVQAGGILFLGTLAFVSMAPWFFIGMKFQSDMAIVLGVTALLQAIAAVVFIPPLIGAFQKK
jgi:predicted RND superfamily exporter protein